MAKCDLCEKGFPLVDGYHIPTQRLGMIPVTRCKKLPPLPVEARIARRILAEAPQTVLGFAGPVVIERIVREELEVEHG